MKRMLAMIALLACLLLSACSPTNVPKEQLFWYMDTAITVRLYGDASAACAALDECDDILSDTDRLLSATQEDSPVSRFNASADGSEVDMPDQVLALVALALDLSRTTGGAFDITTAPLTALWTQCEQSNALPLPAELASVLALVGSGHVRLTASSLTKELPDVRIDLGAIGKGYAMNLLLDTLLKTDGLSGGIVSMGSNVAVFGEKPDGSPWRIALRHPNDASAAVGYLHLTEGQVLSVSGDYERYFTVNGQHYSHILDPQTGYPPTGELRSVAVLCESGATADALSTAFMVMGEQAARTLYEDGTLAFEAVFVYDDRVSTTDGITLH